MRGSKALNMVLHTYTPNEVRKSHRDNVLDGRKLQSSTNILSCFLTNF